MDLKRQQTTLVNNYQVRLNNFMTKRKTISVAIVAHNEETNLQNCLESCNWADEVAVVDAGSTDKTAYLAKKMKAKVYTVENQPLMKINMNLSFEKCQSDWIFSLDADERITQELQEEIKTVINSDSKYVAYRIPRKNIIFRKWIAHTGWYPDYQIRLFRKGRGKFPAKNVHELLTVDGPIGTLKNDIEHQNYKTVSEFIEKLNRYTDIEAEKLIKEKRKVTWIDSLVFPKEEFLKRFFAHRGYKDGLHGLVLSLMMAFYWEVVFAKVWERKENFKDLFYSRGSTPKAHPSTSGVEPQKGKHEVSRLEFLTAVIREFEKAAKDIRYWIYESLISENPAKKLYWRLRRKLR